MKKILINFVVLLMFSTSAFSKDVKEIIGFQLEFNQLNFVKNLENFNILEIYDKETAPSAHKWMYKTKQTLVKNLAYETEINDLLRTELLPDGTDVIDMIPITVEKFVYKLEYKDFSKAPPYEEIELHLLCYDGFVNSNQLDINDPKQLKKIRNGKGCEWPFIERIEILVEPGRGSNEPNCKNDFNFYRDYFLNTYALKSWADWRKTIEGTYSSTTKSYVDSLLPQQVFFEVGKTSMRGKQKGLSQISLDCSIPSGGVRISVRVTQSFEELNTAIKIAHKELIEAANNKIKNSKENETGGL